jgi:hypothetical protein
MKIKNKKIEEKHFEKEPQYGSWGNCGSERYYKPQQRQPSLNPNPLLLSSLEHWKIWAYRLACLQCGCLPVHTASTCSYCYYSCALAIAPPLPPSNIKRLGELEMKLQFMAESIDSSLEAINDQQNKNIVVCLFVYVFHTNISKIDYLSPFLITKILFSQSKFNYFCYFLGKFHQIFDITKFIK